MILTLLLIAASPFDYGAIGDCRHNDGPVIQAMLDNPTIEEIDFRGCACFKSEQTLFVPKRMRLFGDKPYRFAGGHASGQYLKFGAGLGGIVFLPGSAFSKLENIALIGTKQRIGVANGIDVRTSVELSDVIIYDFDGDGIHAECGGTSNCNLARLNDVTTETNGGWGLWVSGGDSNSWFVERFHANQNDAGCLYSRSFLGSHYEQVLCQDTDGVLRGGVLVDNPNAHNVFDYVYIEGAAPLRVRSPSVVLGGFHGAMTYDSSVLEGGVHKGMWSFFNDLEQQKAITLILGTAAGARCAFAAENSYPNQFGNPASGLIRFCADDNQYDFRMGGGTVKAIEIGDVANTEMGWGGVALTRGLFIGAKNNRRSYKYSGGTPTDACLPGDIRTNSAFGDRNEVCALFACRVNKWVCVAREAP